ncbi:MAG: preprotein translocase subunit YajC [Myxococcota bacterium]
MDSAAVMWLQAAGPPAWEQPVVMMLFLGVTMYLLLIRPEQKRRKEQEALLKSIAKGDRVVTAGGIRGTVVGVTDDVLTLEVGKGGSVKIEVERARVERKLETAKGEVK